MALFQSGNPTLAQKIFDRSLEHADGGVMTVRGSMNKFGFLMIMVVASAGYTWHLFYQGKPETVNTLLWVGLIGGLVTGLVICFKPAMARYLAPLYGILEGLFVGAISAILNMYFAKKFPNIIPVAVGLTLAVSLAMFLLYNFRIIKATQRFKSIIFTATLGIAIFYAFTWILALFGVYLPFLSLTNSSNPMLGIGISLFVVAVAALNLILDFDMIEQGAAARAPKHMEWYGAFGLLVTIVWLYIELLKLLARIASSRS